MSIFNCHKQEPQPWMSYISQSKICFPGGCCPSLVTDNFSLLPFQIISEGDYIRSEISVYGSGVWTEVTLPITSVVTEGFYIHSYDGSTIAELDCGAYEFRVVAGETWWFEPFTVEDFEFTENAYKLRDLLMTPLKFSEQLVSCGSIVAPCDSFLPFMYTTENATSGSPTYTLVSLDGTETALTITVDVLTIDGRTYYIHDGECFYPFLECGRYYIRIDDGAYVYFSAWFDAVCEVNDIPDGYRAMRDANGCVMRDDEGEILIEECSDMPPPTEDINYGLLYNRYVVDDARNVVSDGWHVPTRADFNDLGVYLGGAFWEDAFYNGYYFGFDNVGDELKSDDPVYWDTPSGNNLSGFNARGSGYRMAAGDYFGITLNCELWISEVTVDSDVPDGTAMQAYIYDNYDGFIVAPTSETPDKNYGISIRPIKDSTILTHGQEGTYTDPSGITYRTICIGTQEWVADNIATRHYRNGDPIPEVTDNGAWLALVTGALCAYNNDWNNV